jgi:hypothetical protein
MKSCTFTNTLNHISSETVSISAPAVHEGTRAKGNGTSESDAVPAEVQKDCGYEIVSRLYLHEYMA